MFLPTHLSVAQAESNNEENGGQKSHGTVRLRRLHSDPAVQQAEPED